MRRRLRKKNCLKKAKRYKRVLINKGFTESNGYKVTLFRTMNGVEYGVRVITSNNISVFIFPSLIEHLNYSLRAFDTTFTKEYFKEDIA